jgi:hypothetical protein
LDLLLKSASVRVSVSICDLRSKKRNARLSEGSTGKDILYLGNGMAGIPSDIITRF